MDPPVGWPTPSLVPIDVPIAGHRWTLVAGGHVHLLDPALPPQVPAAVWTVDITYERRLTAVGCFRLPEFVGVQTPPMTACHQPLETIIGHEVPAAWFASGMRVRTPAGGLRFGWITPVAATDHRVGVCRP